ncbi:hypothetical protein KC865_04815 [Candidatus Kaiserbacteria bacterium]|nr:hypothetical protein [Candidatus Kaiserbacteria bacterium]USN92274.1 MAG: hypothetical protein H6782_00405 [Candidatus Nomurabacteria bacterium]
MKEIYQRDSCTCYILEDGDEESKEEFFQIRKENWGDKDKDEKDENAIFVVVVRESGVVGGFRVTEEGDTPPQVARFCTKPGLYRAVSLEVILTLFAGILRYFDSVGTPEACLNIDTNTSLLKLLIRIGFRFVKRETGTVLDIPTTMQFIRI